MNRCSNESLWITRDQGIKGISVVWTMIDSYHLHILIEECIGSGIPTNSLNAVFDDKDIASGHRYTTRLEFAASLSNYLCDTISSRSFALLFLLSEGFVEWTAWRHVVVALIDVLSLGLIC